jgi:pullulanase
LSNDELAKKRLTKDEKDKGTALLKLAVAALWTLPGLPTIYYGDESGLEGYRDPFNRMPYPWRGENMDILDFYKAMGSLRINNKCYKDGRFDLYLLNDDILVFTRSYKDVRCLTLINRSDKSYGFSFDSNALSLISGKRSKSFTLSAVSFDIIKTNVKNFDGMVTYCE